MSLNNIIINEAQEAERLFHQSRAIVREIYARWPSVRVKFLDPDRIADANDKPFIITEICRDGVERIIMQVERLDNNVIQELHRIDMAISDNNLAFEQAIQKALREKEAKEKENSEEAKDIVTVGAKHFNKGKLKFKFTDEFGEKKVVS